jgi:hypothetical protein
MATRLLPVFKNGDADSRLGYIAIWIWWKSEESRLARLTIMSEVLLGEMYSQSSTILKHI